MTRILVPSAGVVTLAATSAGGWLRLAAAAREAGAVAVLFPDVDGSGPGIEPSVAALGFGLAATDLGVLVTASSQRDAPYNLARRILSLDHFLAGRVGVVLAPHVDGTDDVADAVEEADLLRELWNSWPRDSIVGDKDAGVFAETERIRRVEHRGRYVVDGPLTTPSSPQGEPVLVWDGPAAPASIDLALDALSLVHLESLAPLENGRASDPSRSPLPRTLRSLLGLAERHLDTSTWPPAFAPAARTGAS